MRRGLQSIQHRVRDYNPPCVTERPPCSLLISPETGASTPDPLAIQLLFEGFLCGGTVTGESPGRILNPVWGWGEAHQDACKADA